VTCTRRSVDGRLTPIVATLLLPSSPQPLRVTCTGIHLTMRSRGRSVRTGMRRPPCIAHPFAARNTYLSPDVGRGLCKLECCIAPAQTPTLRRRRRVGCLDLGAQPGSGSRVNLCSTCGGYPEEAGATRLVSGVTFIEGMALKNEAEHRQPAVARCWWTATSTAPGGLEQNLGLPSSTSTNPPWQLTRGSAPRAPSLR
jgi:hypothetical protein